MKADDLQNESRCLNCTRPLNPNTGQCESRLCGFPVPDVTTHNWTASEWREYVRDHGVVAVNLSVWLHLDDQDTPARAATILSEYFDNEIDGLRKCCEEEGARIGAAFLSIRPDQDGLKT